MTTYHALPIAALAGLATLAVSLSPAPASACGGLFCSNAPTPVQLQPVEQNAERVLFEVNGDGTVTATVEILYSGEPDAFSWIVPVPGQPELDVAPPAAMLLLDDASAPTLWNQPTVCRSGRGCNLAGPLGVAAPQVLSQIVRDAAAVPLALTACSAGESLRGAGDDDDYWDEGVDVFEYPQVGPFEAEVVSSDDPDAVIAWLNDNDYLVTPEMEPFVVSYIQGGMNFLAMKLAAGEDVSSIAPLRMTYSAEQPMLPIRLTAVSAEPDMGILVFVAADERWQAANYGNLTVDPYDVRSDPNTGQTNYYALLSWVADLHGGHALFTEYSGDTAPLSDTLLQRYGLTFPEEQDFVAGLARDFPTITRLYTRLSAWEMTIDPVFEASAGGDVDNRLDLGDNPPLDICSPEPAIAACGNQYCGEGATCATTELGQGCVCGEGFVARQVMVPEVAGTLAASVTCQDLGFDLMGSLPDLIGGPIDACGIQTCGEFGECLTLNGFATCECDDGYAAVAVFDNGSLPVCTPVLGEFGPESIVGVSPAAVPSLAEAAGDTARRSPIGTALGFGLLLIPVLMARRRS